MGPDSKFHHSKISPSFSRRQKALRYIPIQRAVATYGLNLQYFLLSVKTYLGRRPKMFLHVKPNISNIKKKTPWP